MFASFAENEYQEMDTNKDNCVSKEEYVKYNIANDEKDTSTFTPTNPQEFYQELYDDIPHQIPNCLTKEEYIKDELPILYHSDDDNVEEYIEHNITNKDDDETEGLKEKYEEINTNNDECITPEEYHQYISISEKNTPTYTQSINYKVDNEIYNQLKTLQITCLTKETFIFKFSLLLEIIKD